jgi:hypothetical protein
MYRAAEEHGEEAKDFKLPDELKETVSTYNGLRGLIPLAAMGAAYYRWRIEESHPGCHYEIKPQAERRVLGEQEGVGLVDEAVITTGKVHCAIAFTPRKRRLELQIANCPLSREKFERAEILLRRTSEVLRPSVRRHSAEFCLAVFEEVDPLGSYVLEIDPELLKG